MIYHVYAINHMETVIFEESFLDGDYAFETFFAVADCVDCAFACITNGLTGEVIADFHN